MKTIRMRNLEKEEMPKYNNKSITYDGKRWNVLGPFGSKLEMDFMLQWLDEKYPNKLTFLIRKIDWAGFKYSVFYRGANFGNKMSVEVMKEYPSDYKTSVRYFDKLPYIRATDAMQKTKASKYAKEIRSKNLLSRVDTYKNGYAVWTHNKEEYLKRKLGRQRRKRR